MAGVQRGLKEQPSGKSGGSDGGRMSSAVLNEWLANERKNAPKDSPRPRNPLRRILSRHQAKIETPCDALYSQWADSTEWAGRWNAAIFMVGIATAISLVIGIGFVVIGLPGQALGTAVGGIVTGAAMGGFIQKERNDVRALQRADLDLLFERCNKEQVAQSARKLG